VKIVTGAEVSQFKNMRFRNYCKFSCTSGSACPRAYGGRSRPRGPGDEDGDGVLLAKMADIQGAIGRQFQSLSIVFVCAVNTKLASLSSSYPGLGGRGTRVLAPVICGAHWDNLGH
jgi:hypothetical protein